MRCASPCAVDQVQLAQENEVRVAVKRTPRPLFASDACRYMTFSLLDWYALCHDRRISAAISTENRAFFS
jgi:hypothetical protein